MTNRTSPDRGPIPYVERMRGEFMRAAQRETADTRRRIGRLTVPAFAAVLVLVLGTVGAAAWMLSRPLNEPNFVTCYEDGLVGGDAATVPTDGQHPVARCAQLDSRFAGGTACTLDNGTIGVFPADSGPTCAERGLDPLPADYQQQADRHAQLETDLQAAVPQDGTCLGPDEAERRIRDVLAEHDASHWTVDFTESHPGMPCASINFAHPGDETVIVGWRETQAVFDTKYELHERFQDQCIPPDEAVDIIERELTDAGYENFDVRLEGAEPDGCAMLLREESAPGQTTIIFVTTQSR